MRLGMYLTSLTKPELEGLRERLNLTDDEIIIFDLLSRGKSNTCICDKCVLSSSALDRKISKIKAKINRLKGC